MQSPDRATASTPVAGTNPRIARDDGVPTMLQMQRMTEPEHEVAVAELEHETALAGVDTRGL